MNVQRVLITGLGMLIDTVMLFSYFSCYNIKENRRLCGAILYITYFIINFMFGLIEFPFWYKILCIIGMVMAVGHYLYDEISIYTIGKEALIFVMLLGIAELLIMPFVFLETGDYDVEIFNDASRPYLWIISMGLSRSIAIGLFKIYRKNRIRHCGKLDKREMVLLYFPLVISFACFGIIIKMVANANNFDKNSMFNSLVLFVCALFFLTVIHMGSFERYINYRDNIQSIFMSTQKNNLQYQYY